MRTKSSLAAVVVLLFCGVAAAESQGVPEINQYVDVLDVLIDALRHPDAAVHEPAGQALTALGPPAIDVVANALDSNDTEFRIRAVEVLRKIGDPRGLAPLAELYRTSEEPRLRAAAVTAMARIFERRFAAQLAAAPGQPLADADALKRIAGSWETSWGPMTLEARREGGIVVVTGRWVQGPGMIGAVTRGTFDPETRVFEFDFDEPWHNQTGTATFTMSPDGQRLSGTWTFTAGGGGAWTMERGNAFAPPHGT